MLGISDKFQIGMDHIEFQTTAQRVYQYLRRYAAKADLDEFNYSKKGNTVEGDVHDCLHLFLQYVSPHLPHVHTLISMCKHTGIVV